MQKLIITIVDVENNGIGNVKDNIQEALSNCPYNLKVDFEVSEALYEDRDVFIVFNKSLNEQQDFNSLESALSWARDMIAKFVRPADMSIKQGKAVYIEGKFFDGYDDDMKVIFKDLEFLFG